MFDNANPLPNPFPLPTTSCGDDGGHYLLHYETEMSWSGSINLTEAQLECSEGGKKIDLVAKEGDLTEEQTDEVKATTQQIIGALGDLDEEVPTDTDQLQSIAGDTSHPITATILGELVQLVSGLSGVGVFSLVTTILQKMIVSPSGWTYVPAVVCVILSNAQDIAERDSQEMRSEFEKLDKEFEENGLTEDDYNQRKREIVQEQF